MVVAVKAKGFSLFPGIAGKCSPPTAGSLASGVGEGSGILEYKGFLRGGMVNLSLER